MADVKDPAIADAYEKVRSDKDETAWMLLDYESDKSNKLVLTATGTGGVPEFVSHLQPQRASYGFIRVRYANDEHSFREKFALVVWIGEEVKIMRRAKVSVHLSDVKSIIRFASIEIQASNANDLKEDDVVQRLRRAGGANYDRSKFD